MRQLCTHQRCDIPRLLLIHGLPLSLSLAPSRISTIGKLLSQFEWRQKNLVAMSWNDREDLVCVLDSGTVLIYTIHGENIGTYSLGDACARDLVADVHFWPTGLAVRTGARELYVVQSYEAFKVSKLPDVGLKYPPTAMTVIPPRDPATGSPQVVLAATLPAGGAGAGAGAGAAAAAAGAGASAGKSVVMTVGKRGLQDQVQIEDPYIRMVCSPEATAIACFSAQGTLSIMAADFSKIFSKFDTKSKVPPREMAWCGEDSVVLYWDKPVDLLLMVGPAGSFTRYIYQSPLLLVSEIDGLRVLSRDKCEFLQRVPDSTDAIFAADNKDTSPALLFDAALAFEQKSVRADENMQKILSAGGGSGGGSEFGELEQAIDSVLDAAAQELNPEAQRVLLEAASFGKLSCAASYPADKFPDMCRILRVLNAVRQQDVGIPLTYAQFLRLEVDVLIDRLVNRHEHLLALRICQYLRVHPERVLIHWACVKIKRSADDRKVKDAELGQLIVKKLLSICPGISFRQVALTAFHSTRRALAAMLLEYEPKASDQVPLFLAIKEDELALAKAVDSGDTDLILTVVLHIRDARVTGAGEGYKEFFRAVHDKPVARNLYISYLKQLPDLKELRNFYNYMQAPVDAAGVWMLEAYQSGSSMADRMQSLRVALDFLARDKAREPFPAQALEEHLELLAYQDKWEKELQDPTYLDNSVSELIEKYILNGQNRKALKIKEVFRVPDKRYQHIEVRAVCVCGA